MFKLHHLFCPLVLCSGLIHSYTASATDNIETAGDALLVLIPGVTYGSTFYMNDSDGRIQFYKSFATSLAVTTGLKLSIDKKRPNGEDNMSFPSGHSSTTFQSAAFIQRRYGWKYAVPAYIGASFVGYSRVEAKKHYVEDVLAGAAIGMMSSLYFTTPYEGTNISAFTEKGNFGLRLIAKW